MGVSLEHLRSLLVDHLLFELLLPDSLDFIIPLLDLRVSSLVLCTLVFLDLHVELVLLEKCLELLSLLLDSLIGLNAGVHILSHRGHASLATSNCLSAKSGSLR